MNINCHIDSLRYGLIVSLLWLTGCSSHLPETIKNPPAINPELQQVQTHLAEYISDTVRWGGIIVDIQNNQNGSQLTIVAFPLTSNGEPILDVSSQGRFISTTEKFLEPTVYTSKRLITISGPILGSEIKNIGEYPYNHIVVKMEHHYLWPEKTAYKDDYPPDYWWYDPWYPWYPYYPHYYPHRY